MSSTRAFGEKRMNEFLHAPISTDSQTLPIVDEISKQWFQQPLSLARVGEITFYPNGYRNREIGQVLRYIHNGRYQGKQFRIENIKPEILFPVTIPHRWNKETLVLRRVV